MSTPSNRFAARIRVFILDLLPKRRASDTTNLETTHDIVDQIESMPEKDLGFGMSARIPRFAYFAQRRGNSPDRKGSRRGTW